MQQMATCVKDLFAAMRGLSMSLALIFVWTNWL